MPNLTVAAGMSVPGSGGAGWKRSDASAAIALQLRSADSASWPTVSWREVQRRIGRSPVARFAAQRGSAAGWKVGTDGPAQGPRLAFALQRLCQTHPERMGCSLLTNVLILASGFAY